MYICIEGNIGAGKTTIAKVLAKHYKIDFVGERFEENLLLPLFYRNKKKLAFSLEYSFLMDRYAQLSKEFQGDKKRKIIADYSLYKCLWFAKSTLSKKDYLFYKKHFKIIENEIPKPDLIIYLNTSFENLLSNIKKRGRKYEKTIDKKYLSSVTKNYSKGLKKLENIEVLEIKIDKYKSDTNTHVLNKIEKYLNKHKQFK